MTKHVVVIGAGVVGAATAHHCLRAGLSVTLLDPGQPGQAQAASFGNAGWLSPHSILPPAYPGVWKQVPSWLLDPLGPLTVRWRHLPRALPWLKDYLASAWTYQQIKQTSVALRALLNQAPDLHKAMATAIGVGELIKVREVLHAYRTQADFQADSVGWEIRREAGITWREYSHGSLQTLEPELSPDYQCGVLVDNTGYCVNPSLYVQTLVADSVKSGAKLLQASALSFGFEGDVLKSVQTDIGLIECDAAVIAVGARAQALARQAGDEVPLATERGYHYVVQAPGKGPNHPTMFMDKKLIVTPMASGLRIAGQVEIAGLDDVPNWQRAQVLRTHLASIYPGLASRIAADQINVWMGRRPSLPDGLPCIGFASRGRSVVHAYGHGHVGLASSARTGRVVGQLLAGLDPVIDLKPFSPLRFKQ
jgi:D-amino-acid dehydrogenase